MPYSRVTLSDKAPRFAHTCFVPVRFRFSWPLALAVGAWALNYVALKLVYQQMTASQLAFLRYVVMYVALVLLCLVGKQSLRIPKGDFWRVMFFGFLSMGVYLLFFLEAMRYAGPAEGAILLNTSPILTMLLASLMGMERLRAGSLAGAIVAFLGIVLVTIPGIAHDGNNAVGYALMELAALTWAYSIVWMKPLLQKYSPLRLLTLGMPGGLPLMLGYWLVRDHGHMPLATITPLGWLEFAHVALLSGVMGFLLFYRGVHEVGPAEAASWMYFVPPLTALLQWGLAGIALKPLQILGMAIVLVGVATAQRFRAPSPVLAAPAEPA